MFALKNIEPFLDRLILSYPETNFAKKSTPKNSQLRTKLTSPQTASFFGGGGSMLTWSSIWKNEVLFWTLFWRLLPASSPDTYLLLMTLKRNFFWLSGNAVLWVCTMLITTSPWPNRQKKISIFYSSIISHSWLVTIMYKHTQLWNVQQDKR